MKPSVKLILIISLLFNIVGLFFIAKRVYYYNSNKPQSVAIKESYYHSRHTIYDLFPIKKNDIVFIGDSQTQQFDLPEYLPGVPAVNRGINGDNTKDVLGRIDKVTSGQPQKVFIEIGFNDLKLDESPQGTKINIASIIQNIQLKSPETKIFMCNIFPTLTPINAIIPKINADLLGVSKKCNVTYIDINSKLALKGMLNPAYDSGDGIHLNGQGYLVWANLLKQYL